MFQGVDVFPANPGVSPNGMRADSSKKRSPSVFRFPDVDSAFAGGGAYFEEDDLQVSHKTFVEHLRRSHDAFFDQLTVQLRCWMETQERAWQSGFKGSQQGYFADAMQRELETKVPSPRVASSDADSQRSASPAKGSGAVSEQVANAVSMAIVVDDESEAAPLRDLGVPSPLGKQSTMDAAETMRKKRSAVSVGALEMYHASDAVVNNPVKFFVTSTSFDNLSAFMVIINAVFIGIQIEFLFMFSRDTPSAFEFIDYGFTAVFFIELLLRLYAYGFRGFFMLYERAWNFFDLVVVSLTTLDTLLALIAGKNSPLGSISFLRLVRTVRITKALKILSVLSFFRDLRVLSTAIVGTLKMATMAFLILITVMYMFGLGIAQMTAEYAKEQYDKGEPLADDHEMIVYWGSIAKSVYTLFLTVAGGIDWEVAAIPLYNLPLAFAIFNVYVLFSCFCLMNTVIGIFCHNAIETFSKDHDKIIEQQLHNLEQFITMLKELLAEVDDGDGLCNVQEFKMLCKKPQFRALCSTLGLEPRDALALFSMMDPENRGLAVEDFIHNAITLRGQASAVQVESVFREQQLMRKRVDDIVKGVQASHLQLAASLGGTSPYLRGAACASPVGSAVELNLPSLAKFKKARTKRVVKPRSNITIDIEPGGGIDNVFEPESRGTSKAESAF